MRLWHRASTLGFRGGLGVGKRMVTWDMSDCGGGYIEGCVLSVGSGSHRYFVVSEEGDRCSVGG